MYKSTRQKKTIVLLFLLLGFVQEVESYGLVGALSTLLSQPTPWSLCRKEFQFDYHASALTYSGIMPAFALGANVINDWRFYESLPEIAPKEEAGKANLYWADYFNVKGGRILATLREQGEQSTRRKKAIAAAEAMQRRVESDNSGSKPGRLSHNQYLEEVEDVSQEDVRFFEEEMAAGVAGAKRGYTNTGLVDTENIYTNDQALAGKIIALPNGGGEAKGSEQDKKTEAQPEQVSASRSTSSDVQGSGTSLIVTNVNHVASLLDTNKILTNGLTYEEKEKEKEKEKEEIKKDAQALADGEMFIACAPSDALMSPDFGLKCEMHGAFDGTCMTHHCLQAGKDLYVCYNGLLEIAKKKESVFDSSYAYICPYCQLGFSIALIVQRALNGIVGNTDDFGYRYCVLSAANMLLARKKAQVDIFNAFYEVNNGECPLCFEESRVLHPKHQACEGHAFCFSCISAYLKECSSSGYGITPLGIECPHDCKQTVNDACIGFFLGSEEEEKIHWKISEMLAAHNENLCVCLVCHKLIDAGSGLCGNRLLCPYCSESSCIVCQVTPFHSMMPCHEYQSIKRKVNPESAKSEFLFRDMVAKAPSSYKNCPVCKSSVYKEFGCNKMYCSQCRTTFCWVCFKTELVGYYHFQNNAQCTLWDIDNREEVTGICQRCRKNDANVLECRHWACRECEEHMRAEADELGQAYFCLACIQAGRPLGENPSASGEELEGAVAAVPKPDDLPCVSASSARVEPKEVKNCDWCSRVENVETWFCNHAFCMCCQSQIYNGEYVEGMPICPLCRDAMNTPKH